MSRKWKTAGYSESVSELSRGSNKKIWGSIKSIAPPRGEVSRKSPLFFGDLIRYYLHKLVIVKTSEGDVRGVLRYYQTSDKVTHRPFVLVVETEGVKIIVRAWNTIATDEQISHF